MTAEGASHPRSLNQDKIMTTPSLEASTPKVEVADGWRRLALQFDGHRMQAISHLKAMIAFPSLHTVEAIKFLKAAPLEGEAILNKRIKEMGVVVDWAQAGALIEAHTVATRNHVGGTANWAASIMRYMKKNSPQLETAPLASREEAIGEMRDNGVTWYNQNPHAYPFGTKFFAVLPVGSSAPTAVPVGDYPVLENMCPLGGESAKVLNDEPNYKRSNSTGE